jgi:hypothetical protein
MYSVAANFWVSIEFIGIGVGGHYFGWTFDDGHGNLSAKAGWEKEEAVVLVIKERQIGKGYGR